MVVRFEPDTQFFGVIFATIRDGKGNFLWQEHAGCRELLMDSGHVALFEDASARLVGKLPLISKFIPQVAVQPHRTVAQSEIALLVGTQ
jgi:hypothetical protein